MWDAQNRDYPVPLRPVAMLRSRAALRGGDPTSSYNDPARVKVIAAASEQAGFTRGHAPGDGNNCFIHSLLQEINNANGKKVDDITKQEDYKAWVQTLRHLAVQNGFSHTEHLGVSDQVHGKPDAKLRKDLEDNLDKFVLKIWSHDENRNSLMNVDIVKGAAASKIAAPVELNMLYDREHFDPLFINKKTEVRDLNEFNELTIELAKLKTEADVSVLIKQKVENFFKHGLLEKTDNTGKYISSYDVKVYNSLVDIQRAIEGQQSIIEKIKDIKAITQEYLLYYPGERSRIESTPKENLNIALMSHDILSKLDADLALVEQVKNRMRYDRAISSNKDISEELKDLMPGDWKETEFAALDKLRGSMKKMADMEVGDKLNPSMVDEIKNYLQNGSFNENIKNPVVVAIYKEMKIKLMQIADDYATQFKYYDYQDARNGFESTLEKYDGYREKIDLIEKMREKINSEIKISNERFGAEAIDVSGQMKGQVTKLLSLKKLTPEDQKYWEDYLGNGVIGRNVIAAENYFRINGVMDEELKVDWVIKIRILQDISKKLRSSSEKIKNRVNELNNLDIARILNRVHKDINLGGRILSDLEIEQACNAKGLTRGTTPGNDENCVLETITKTINRATGKDKENPRAAYKDAADWQKILRAIAVATGIRERIGIMLFNRASVASMEYCASKYITVLDREKNATVEFHKKLEENLDNYILSIWKYDQETKTIYKNNEIRGINAFKTGVKPVRINLYSGRAHAEPMYSIEELPYEQQNTEKKSKWFKSLFKKRGGDPTSSYSGA